MKKKITIVLVIIMFVISYAYSQEKVQLTGYIADTACASKHVNDKPEDAAKCTVDLTKDCALKKNCVAIRAYEIFADNKWYPLSLGSNKMIKPFLAKTSKEDHLKVTITGIKHAIFIQVESITTVK